MTEGETETATPTDAKVCFVISPIGDLGSPTRRRAAQVLRHIIEPVVSGLGYSAQRADSLTRPGIITNQVIQLVADADLVVADLTDHNPNVFYELAIRHALQLPLVQLIDSGPRSSVRHQGDADGAVFRKPRCIN